MPERRAGASDDTEHQVQDIASRRATWRAYKRASARALGLGLTLALLVAGAVLFVSLVLLEWPAWLTWFLAALAFLVALVVTVQLTTPDRPDWPPRRPEYDAPPEPVGRWSRLAYELSDKPFRDMQAKRRERRRLSSQRSVRGPGTTDHRASSPGSRTRQLLVIVAAVLGLALVVGAAVAWLSPVGSSRERYREERRKELKRFERDLPPELREQWEEHKRSGK